jgi:secretion/DNA translocation related TadE-like protein
MMRWLGRQLRRERGAGGVLALALVGATVLLAALTLPIGAVLAGKQRAISAADAAALAAADVAAGIVAGFPCEVAASVADANGSRLTACEVDGLVATVHVAASVVGLPVTASATAGPPP